MLRLGEVTRSPRHGLVTYTCAALRMFRHENAFLSQLPTRFWTNKPASCPEGFLSFSLSIFLPHHCLSPLQTYLVLRIAVLALPFYLIVKAHCRSLHGQLAQRLSKQKYPNAEIRRHSFCLCRSLRDCRSLFCKRPFACEARYECRPACSRFTPSRTFTSFDCERPPAFAGFGPVRAKHCIMVFSSVYPFPIECSRSGRIQARGDGQSLGYLQDAPSGPYVHLSTYAMNLRWAHFSFHQWWHQPWQ